MGRNSQTKLFLYLKKYQLFFLLTKKAKSPAFLPGFLPQNT